MARINVEDNLFSDPRYQAIENKLGKFQTMGAWVHIARAAQRYWSDEEQPIPRGVWELNELRLLVALRLR